MGPVLGSVPSQSSAGTVFGTVPTALSVGAVFEKSKTPSVGPSVDTGVEKAPLSPGSASSDNSALTLGKNMAEIPLVSQEAKTAKGIRQVGQMGGLAPGGPISPGSGIPFPSFPESEIPSRSPHGPGSETQSLSLEGTLHLRVNLNRRTTSHWFKTVLFPQAFRWSSRGWPEQWKQQQNGLRKRGHIWGTWKLQCTSMNWHRRKNFKQTEKSVQDQFVVASTLRPRRYRARYLESAFQGRTARQDAEEAERARWIQILADMLKGTATPMGQLPSDSPSNTKLLGGGRRV